MTITIRLSSEGPIESWLLVGDEWIHIGKFERLDKLTLDVTGINKTSLPPVMPDSLEGEEDADVPDSQVLRMKRKIARAARAVAALPSLPIPLFILALSSVLYGMSCMACTVLPLKPFRTLFHEILKGQLAMCEAIEKEIMG